MAFRRRNRAAFPDWHNAPVASFGAGTARLLIVGLAPGLRGANRTGRPFTGDHAGQLLYSTLLRFGFATGSYAARPDDGLRLVDCRVTNAVRCVPPENRPTTAEIRVCGRFLEREIRGLPRLRMMLALGAIAHGSILASCGLVRSRWPFAHGARHRLPTLAPPALAAPAFSRPEPTSCLRRSEAPASRRQVGRQRPEASPRRDGLVLADSYHCSRYNLNTGRLTEDMFHAVFAAIRDTLAAVPTEPPATD